MPRSSAPCCPAVLIMHDHCPLPSNSLFPRGFLPSSRPTSPLPLRAGPRPTRISRPNTSRHSSLGSTTADFLPLTPSANRKRDRAVCPTSSYALCTPSALHQPSLPGSLKQTPSSFQFGSSSSKPVADGGEDSMSLCQQFSYSPLDSSALDYFGKAKAVVSTHTSSIRSGLGLGSDSKPDEHESDLEPESERATKRRKGVAGILISTALDAAIDAAIFTSAVGFAAFQIWRGKPFEELIRPQLPPPVPLTPPPPYEPCPSSPPRPRPSPMKRTPSSQRKITHIHVPRPRPNRTYLSSNPSFYSPIPNFALDSPSLNTPPIRTSTHAPEDEDDLMSDFVPSFSHYVPPPPVPEEPFDDELEADEEAWKNQIRGLIRSGEAALAAPAEVPAFVEPELESTPARTLMRVERLKKSKEMQALESALDQTVRGSGRNWWESC